MTGRKPAGAADPRLAAERQRATVEDVLWLLRSGADRDEIARRIGRTWPTIERQLQRIGRRDVVSASAHPIPQQRAVLAAACDRAKRTGPEPYAPTWAPEVPSELVEALDAAFVRHLDHHHDWIALGGAA